MGEDIENKYRLKAKRKTKPAGVSTVEREGANKSSHSSCCWVSVEKEDEEEEEEEKEEEEEEEEEARTGSKIFGK